MRSITTAESQLRKAVDDITDAVLTSLKLEVGEVVQLDGVSLNSYNVTKSPHTEYSARRASSWSLVNVHKRNLDKMKHTSNGSLLSIELPASSPTRKRVGCVVPQALQLWHSSLLTAPLRWACMPVMYSTAAAAWSTCQHCASTARDVPRAPIVASSRAAGNAFGISSADLRYRFLSDADRYQQTVFSTP